MLVTKIFSFDSAHNLTDYYGKCERLHGHKYRLEVTLEGDIQSNGLVIDFLVLKNIVKKHVLEKLDHRYLNDIIDNPSAERIVMWIWEQLADLPYLLKDEVGDPNLAKEIKALIKDDGSELGAANFDETLRLHELVLWETDTSKVTYRGE